MTCIRVDTVPVAQPRQRVAVKMVHGKPTACNYVSAFDPVHTFKAAVQSAWANAKGNARLSGPVAVNISFVFACPPSRRTKKNAGYRQAHVIKPDIDNLIKATCDALNGFAWHDDKQVCEVRTSKAWGAEGELPHVVIVVSEVKPVYGGS